MTIKKDEDQSGPSAQELGKDLAVYAGLLGFGFIYNKFVERINRTHGQHGYTAFLVVFGVLVTLAALSIRIGARNTLKLAAGFGFSGLPMILGDTSRHLRYRQEVAATLARARNARRGMDHVGQAKTGERQGSEIHTQRD